MEWFFAMPGVRVQQGQKIVLFSYTVQTGSGAHTASHSVSIEDLFRGLRWLGREVGHHLHLVSRRRISRATPTHTPSCHGRGQLYIFNVLNVVLPYILESNPRPFYSFRGLKNQMRIRIACGLDSRSWAGFWKNNRAAVRTVRTIQYNNLFYLLFIILYKRLRWSRGSVLAFSTQVRGFKPGRSRRIFRAKKSSARLPSEGK